MNPETLRKALEAIEELGHDLDAQNETPNTAAPVAPVTSGDPAPARSKYLSLSERNEIQRQLRTKTTDELLAMFSIQARKKDTGIPFETWAAAGGNPVYAAIQDDAVLTKALDTTGAAAMIRQDLEPVMLELFIRNFPYWDRIPKEAANGLVHAYVRTTTFGDAEFMSELGTVTDDTSAYERVTTPVSVIATRRGVSLKSQFATLQGGAGFNPEQRELTGGLRAIAHKMQQTIFQGNATTTGAAGATTENGAYDVNAFDGLRKLLSGANGNTTVNADLTGASPDDLRHAIDLAATSAMQNAGRVSNIYLDPNVKTAFDLAQDKNVRYTDTRVEVAPGVLTNAVNTVFGPLPLSVIPGDSIGSYTFTGSTYSGGSLSSATVRDVYLLDEDVISVPYLGSSAPTVLDIPIGISGQLTHLFIIFGMWGLAVKAPKFCNKVRVRV